MLNCGTKEESVPYKVLKIRQGRAILITILFNVSTSSSFRRPIFLDKTPIKIITIIETIIILKSIKPT